MISGTLMRRLGISALAMALSGCTLPQSSTRVSDATKLYSALEEIRNGQISTPILFLDGNQTYALSTDDNQKALSVRVDKNNQEGYWMMDIQADGNLDYMVDSKGRKNSPTDEDKRAYNQALKDIVSIPQVDFIINRRH